MPVSVHQTPTIIYIQLRGLLAPEDATALLESFEQIPQGPTRPALLIDALDTFVPYFPWTDKRRRQLAQAAQRVGPIAIAAQSASSKAQAKHAFDALSSLVVWRVFDTRALAEAWLGKMANHGRTLWGGATAQPTRIQLDRLLHSVNTRRASA